MLSRVARTGLRKKGPSFDNRLTEIAEIGQSGPWQGVTRSPVRLAFDQEQGTDTA